MSKLLTASLTAVLGAAALSGLQAPALAQESPRPDPRILCPWMVSQGYFRSHGDCMSGFRNEGASTCQQMDRAMLDYLGYRNRGECVARLRELSED